MLVKMSYEREVYELFEKVYTIKSDKESWVLPSPQTVYKSKKWQVPVQMMNKINLNCVKKSLSNYPLQQWRRHTASRNPAALVGKKLRKELNSNFITQAWCKFYETLCTFELVHDSAVEAGELKSVHLCEAPGGFVAALNHYLVSNLPDLKWDWLATSINPHHEGNGLDCGIFEDNFLLKTLDKWTFGEDHTGDITHLENMKHLIQEINQRGFKDNQKLLLITADGGIDCQAFPSEQEGAMLNLITCEIIVALSALDLGGNFVLKTFTTFEAETICLIYLLSCAFKSLKAWKPVTSKEGNSEIYFVAKGFIGTDELQPWLEALYACYGIWKDHPMFALDDLPRSFLDKVIEMSRRFMDFQIDAIEENRNSFGASGNPPPMKNKRLLYHNPYKLQKAVENHFFERYHMKPIPLDCQLYTAEEESQTLWKPAISQLNDYYDVNEDLTFSQAELGLNIFEERKSYLCALEKSLTLKDLYKCDPLGFFESIGVAVCSTPTIDFNLETKSITIGQPIKEIKSSKFCHVWFITLHKKIERLWYKLKNPAQKEDSEGEAENKNSFDGSEHSQNDVPSTSQATDCSTESKNNSLSSEDEDEVDLLLESYGESSYKTYFWNEILSSKNLSELMTLMSQLEDGGSLMVKNIYPILRKCNVGLLYLIGQLFEQLLFLWPSEIKRNNEFSVLLHGYKPLSEKHKDICKFLHQVINVLLEEESKDEPKCILDLLSIRHLSSGNFFHCVSYTNHLFLEQSAKRMMNEITELLGLDDTPI